MCWQPISLKDPARFILNQSGFAHLAAASSMRRAHHIARREGRVRSGSHGRPQYLVFSTNSDAPSVGSISSSSPPRGENEVAPAIVTANPTTPAATLVGEFSELTSVAQTHASDVATLTSEARNSQMRSSISCPR
ncbi:hypothetical protein GW17_00016209 [Ensete ventricosum]|nr:hypothetical protein GW17_00016209 [Ensete ventricosum]